MRLALRAALVLASIALPAATPTASATAEVPCEGPDGTCGAAAPPHPPGGSQRGPKELMRQRMLASKHRRRAAAALQAGEAATALAALSEAQTLTPDDQSLLPLIHRATEMLSQQEAEEVSLLHGSSAEPAVGRPAPADPAQMLPQEALSSPDALPDGWAEGSLQGTPFYYPVSDPSRIQWSPPLMVPSAAATHLPLPPSVSSPPVEIHGSNPLNPPPASPPSPVAPPPPQSPPGTTFTATAAPRQLLEEPIVATGELPRVFYRVDGGGTVAFRHTPDLNDRSDVVAGSADFVEAAREPADFPGWIQSGSVRSFGLWLPKQYLRAVAPDSDAYREALWEAEEAEEQEENSNRVEAQMAEGCIDRDPNCHGWAAAKECEKDPGFMIPLCFVSCGICREGDTLPTPQSTRQLIEMYKSDHRRRTGGQGDWSTDAGHRRRARLGTTSTHESSSVPTARLIQTRRSPEMTQTSTHSTHHEATEDRRLRTAAMERSHEPDYRDAVLPSMDREELMEARFREEMIKRRYADILHRRTHDSAGESIASSEDSLQPPPVAAILPVANTKRQLQETRETQPEPQQEPQRTPHVQAPTAQKKVQPGPKELMRQRTLASKHRQRGVAALQAGEAATALAELSEAQTLTPDDQSLLPLIQRAQVMLSQQEADEVASAEVERAAGSTVGDGAEDGLQYEKTIVLPEGWAEGSLEGTPFYYPVSDPSRIQWSPPFVQTTVESANV